MPRDFELNPYSKDEARVVEYLLACTPELGDEPIDDPIGLLIQSSEILARKLVDQLAGQ